MYFLRSPIFKQAFRSRHGLGPEELAHPTFLFCNDRVLDSVLSYGSKGGNLGNQFRTHNFLLGVQGGGLLTGRRYPTGSSASP